MAKRRNYTQELLAARTKGRIIVISLHPHEGVPVEYSPRNAHDPEPWVAELPYRFSGRECHAVSPERIGQFDKDNVLKLVDTLFDGAFQMGQDDHRFDYTTAQMVTILAALTAEDLLARHGDTYVLARKGGLRLRELTEGSAPTAA